MKLVIDNRNTDIVYADKANLQSASGNDILKMINVGKTNNIKNIIELLATSTNISKQAIEVLYVINLLPAYYTLRDLFDIYVVKIGKSRSTFDRGIAELKGKRIIRINNNNQILLDPNYNCRFLENKVKYIVIELNPNETSKGLDL